jgi:aromatic-L-amino-acid decarboxylase
MSALPTTLSPDVADTARLVGALADLLPALADFNRGEPPPAGASDWRSALDQPLPGCGAGLVTVVTELAQKVVPNGLRLGAPGFCGWVTTAPTTSGVAAHIAASLAAPQRAWDHPGHLLEGVALRWLAELLGLPRTAQGVFVSGGATANLVALGAARQCAYRRRGHDVARDGLPPDQPGRIYASAASHHCVLRAGAVLGLGRQGVVLVPTARDGRINLAALRAQLVADRTAGFVPVALHANAGTVHTGAIDPLDALADLADEFGTWLHVDGAYGLFGRLDPRVESLFAGLERADSAVVDPHKWLATPVGCGAVFVRERDWLTTAFALQPAAYLNADQPDSAVPSAASAAIDPTAARGSAAGHSPFDSFGEPYHDYALEQSAPSRGIAVWAVLREIGAHGLRERVVRHHDFARHLADLVRFDPRLELLTKPVLSILCFRYRTPGLDEPSLDALNLAVAARLRTETGLVPSTTRIGHRLALRPCFINPRTTLAEVEALAQTARRFGDEWLHHHRVLAASGPADRARPPHSRAA